MPYVPIIGDDGVRRMVDVQAHPESDEIGRAQRAHAEHDKQHGHDEATARGVVEGAARARTHAEAAEIVRSATRAFAGSDVAGHQLTAGIIDRNSRCILEQARRAELEAAREAVRARMAGRSFRTADRELSRSRED